MTHRGKLTVGLVCGGRSGEHEVSLLSAASVYRAFDPRRYRVVPIGIDQDGTWRMVHPPGEVGPIRLRRGDPEVVLAPGRRPRIRYRHHGRETVIDIDVFFPVLHGPYGEDGTIQGLFEMCGAPYAGAGVLASSVGMDKIAMKAVFEKARLTVAPYVGFTVEDWKHRRIQIEEQVLETLDLPCFIKPSNSGSSVGISKVKKIEQLGAAITEAFRYDRKVLAERAVIGKEIECSVLGNDNPRASLPGEVIPSREYYDYWDKYIGGKTKFKIPADLPGDTVARVQEAAVAAYRAVDCSGMARVDFFLEPADAVHHERLYVNEINTIPGFTNISMYPKLWEVSGLSYKELIDELIDLALRRFAQKSKLRTTCQQGRKLLK